MVVGKGGEILTGLSKKWRRENAKRKREKILEGGGILPKGSRQGQAGAETESSYFLKRRIEILEGIGEEKGLTVNSNIQRL
jgi:hypothetical protein